MFSIRGLEHKSKVKVFAWKQTLGEREIVFAFQPGIFRTWRCKPAGLLMLEGRAAFRKGGAVLQRTWSG